MDINNFKKVMLGGGDGGTVAMLKNKTAYLIQCDGISDALQIMKKKYGIDTGDWMLSNDKAVLVPGIWEYEQAVYIGDMNQDQIADLAEQLREAA